MSSLKLERLAKVSSYALLTGAFVGVIWTGRDFVKFRVGPLFVLELVFIFWFLLFEVYDFRVTFKILWEIWPLVIFCLYGSIRLFFDFLPHQQAFPYTSVSRTLQHSLIFVYPLLWSFAGFQAYRSDKKLFTILCFLIIAAQSLPYLWGESVPNFSVGPIFTVVFVFLLMNLINSPERLWKWKSICLAFFTGILSSLPFWLMWIRAGMERTNFLQNIVTLAIAPIFFSFRNRRIVAVKGAGIALGLFLAGLLICTIAARENVKQQFFSSMQHQEDVPVPGDPHTFRARFRSFAWAQAVRDWKISPVFGVGFVPEIPSYIVPDTLNDGRWHDLGPISGPHNSFLSILSRMGIAGMILFLASMILVARKAVSALKMNEGLVVPLLIICAINGMVYAFFNVGLESPHNCVILWFSIGALIAAASGAPLHCPRRDYPNSLSR